MSRLRVGLIGTGLMGRTHAQGWQAQPGVLTCVYAPDERAREFAREFNLSPCASTEDLLARVDIVDLCTPTPTHHALTVKAAQAGRHVICEKPMALTLAEADGMTAACQAAGVRLFVAHVLRFFPQYRAAWDQVRAGTIGEPRVLRLSRVSSPPPRGSWLLDDAQSGGVPLDLMIHDLDFARWVAGEVDRVYAAGHSHGERAVVQATLSHTSGAISLIEGGWAAPPGVFRTALDLAGTLGVIEWSSDAPAALRGHGPQSGPLPTGTALPALAGDPYAAELLHAYQAIEQGLPFLVGPEDARAALALSHAVRRSLSSGQAARMEDL
ncbi:Gfo/Idh/MocA family oxidoreductase (plasmid) [Deinococcus taeanensis]|uniref:Gfo/Idh/MocA family protein n=1 Tax=Deinococcus taeanensis TaxID=2737050 RepID=UPI001CDC0F94|nr:Gfo/Idh/MocA family oxidoreductase [Deinococcus taeanensis]UBV44498.1 Gfo/Idh/MocA family oxidoreductase [Deinococcus taeanensis]